MRHKLPMAPEEGVVQGWIVQPGQFGEGPNEIADMHKYIHLQK